MKRVRRGKKSEVSPRAVFLARLVYWSLMLAIPIVTFGFYFYGGILCFIAAQSFDYFWLEKRGIFVVNSTTMAWWQATWIYQYFYLPTTEGAIAHWKRLKSYLIIGILCILFGIQSFYMIFTSTLSDLEDMVVIQGSYIGNQKFSRKKPCGDYLLTFHRNGDSPVQLWAFSADMILALENGLKNNEEYTIWGEKNYALIPECRKFMELRQIVGQKYQSMYMRDVSSNGAIKKIGIFLLTMGIIMLWRIVVAGKMLKNAEKRSYEQSDRST